MVVSTIAGCTADGATTAALALDGVSIPAVTVTATAARLRNSLRIGKDLLLVHISVDVTHASDDTRSMQSICCLTRSVAVQHGGDIAAPP
jgi:hypothetical protein